MVATSSRKGTVSPVLILNIVLIFELWPKSDLDCAFQRWSAAEACGFVLEINVSKWEFLLVLLFDCEHWLAIMLSLRWEKYNLNDVDHISIAEHTMMVQCPLSSLLVTFLSRSSILWPFKTCTKMLACDDTSKNTKDDESYGIMQVSYLKASPKARSSQVSIVSSSFGSRKSMRPHQSTDILAALVIY